ncbi:MAG: hypothetical protein N2V78_09470 [Methanophagales archaeon]|nr:hypothetical protein [Methanophagales archaeon]
MVSAYEVNVSVIVSEHWDEEGIFQDVLIVNGAEHPVETFVGSCNVAFSFTMNILVRSEKTLTLRQLGEKVEEKLKNLKISSKNGVDILSVDLDEIVSVRKLNIP